MIKKPTIIVSSLGRTGTTFFTKYYKEIFPKGYSIHEPGMIRLKGLELNNVKDAISVFGFKHAVLRKLLNLPDIKYVSKKRMEGKISKEVAALLIEKLREHFINKIEAPIYIESNYQFQGLLDVLPLSFENYRSIYIIRDPRDWVRSFINWRGLYHWTDIHYLLRNRLSPSAVGDQNYAKKWKKMDQFEKLCWAWQFINNYARETTNNDPNSRVYLFEDIFKSKKKTENLLELTEFTQDIKNIKRKNQDHILKVIDKTLGHKVNKPQTYDFPAWQEWDNSIAKKLQSICGELMDKLGYGTEEEWINKLK